MTLSDWGKVLAAVENNGQVPDIKDEDQSDHVSPERDLNLHLCFKKLMKPTANVLDPCRAGDVITKMRNRLLEESSSAVLLVKNWLNQKTVDDRELYGLDQNLAPRGDAADSARDMQVERQALGERMDAQQEEDFDLGYDLTDIE
ncbi:hypothetical protein FN846DRAFT_910837 [Sphaerosporella brunnea]|uniref:Uncharacterized protein n=1 Tax=Sphaerosporella brunnea TaxID=1250544 RepID=A0A5J5EML5_9PEZI|nr:hypothetical protein FN846DRAFT_910837 [Sphaerosporella brunnea]